MVEATLKLVAPTGTWASAIAILEKPEWFGRGLVLPIEITSRVLVPVAISDSPSSPAPLTGCSEVEEGSFWMRLLGFRVLEFVGV